MYEGSAALACGVLLGSTASLSCPLSRTGRCGDRDVARGSKPPSTFGSRHGCQLHRISLSSEVEMLSVPDSLRQHSSEPYRRGQRFQSSAVVSECTPSESGLRDEGSVNQSSSMSWSKPPGERASVRLTLERTPVLFVPLGDDWRGDGTISQGKLLVHSERVAEGAAAITEVEAIRVQLPDVRSGTSECSRILSMPAEAGLVAFVGDVDIWMQREHDCSQHREGQAVCQEEEEVNGRCCKSCGPAHPARQRVATASLSQALTQATGRVLSYTIGAVARPVSRGNSSRGPAAIAVAVAVAVVLGLATVVKSREDVQANQKICTACTGRGVEACSVCGGEGHICWEGKCNRDTPCPACLGSGLQKCHTCHGVRRKRPPVQVSASKAVEGNQPL